MASDLKFKRNIAFKLRIGDLLIGKPVFDNERFIFLEIWDKKVVRVNLIGNIVDKYESEGEKRYSFLTLDDGSGQIKLKLFGDDVEKSKNISQGQTVLIIGVLKNWKDETYIFPEIIKEQDTKYLLIRKLELEKKRELNAKPLTRDSTIILKDRLLELIKKAEEEGGIEIDKIIMEIKEVSPATINQEIKKMLEEGIIFEPRPGKVRYLG